MSLRMAKNRKLKMSMETWAPSATVELITDPHRAYPWPPWLIKKQRAVKKIRMMRMPIKAYLGAVAPPSA